MNTHAMWRNISMPPMCSYYATCTYPNCRSSGLYFSYIIESTYALSRDLRRNNFDVWVGHLFGATDTFRANALNLDSTVDFKWMNTITSSLTRDRKQGEVDFLLQQYRNIPEVLWNNQTMFHIHVLTYKVTEILTCASPNDQTIIFSLNIVAVRKKS